MTVAFFIITAVCGYLLGSVSLSIVLSKAALGGDVRKKGSGNAGATNMARNYGWAAGLVTLGADIVKAAIAMLLGWLLLRGDSLGDWGIMTGGAAAMLGHCFPAFYGFKGGKGVSTLAAIAVMIDLSVFMLGEMHLTLVVPVGLAVFFLVAVLTRKVSPGSLAAAVEVPVMTAVFGHGLALILLAVFAGLMVIIRHSANISRLIKGTEPDFHAAKKEKKDQRKDDAQ